MTTTTNHTTKNHTTTTHVAADTLTLVTDPTRAGLTIIPTSTPLTRLNYFDGKFLRADDLRLDQTYERLLVNLSVRGGGSGVVHGFELNRHGSGDALILRAGLAMTPSGRALYLPADASFTLAALLSKSGDSSFDPASAPVAGSAGFVPCATSDDGPDVAVTPQPAFVVTIAADEALCGEEERFGELCGDACLTDVDRPRRVEGVRVRARRLDLTNLPVSTQVPFTALHYRSRVATAYFAAEARQIPSLISGAGLASTAWCDGADAANGDEVPIALLAVRGTALEFIDIWTARRELMVEPARCYWAMRMAMRPWDVFLAHILQFQCQLRDGLTGGGVTPTDPCAEERATLRDLHDVITDMGGRLSRVADLAHLADLDVESTDLARWKTLAVKASRYLVAPAAAASGSLLIDRGIVTTPSAGYLPVDPAGDVVAQVRAQFGPGVDLRFCAAPADVVPHLVEQAQHMERVSLTAGLDDPTAKPPVDVIIPDGQVATSAAKSSPVYSGTLRLLPRARITGAVGAAQGNSLTEVGYALQLRAVCRDVDGPGWRWALAAYGEAEQGVAVERLLLALAKPLIRPNAEPPAGDGGTVTVPIFSTVARRSGAPRVVLAANRERTLAVSRRAQLAGRSISGVTAGAAIPPDRPLARDESRPVATWIDVQLDSPLESAPTGTVARGTVLAALYSRAATNPILIHLRLDGTLRISGRVQESSPAGAPETVVTTEFDGVLDPLVVTDEVHNAPPQSFRTTLRWRFGKDASGHPTLLGLVDTQAQMVPAFEASAPASDVRRAAVGAIQRQGAGAAPTRLVNVADEWSAQSSLVAHTIPSTQVLANLDLERDDTALDVGQPDRDLAEAAVESIGAELSPADRDPQFTSRARKLLLPAATAGDTTITPRRDWVMFHRRRVVTCTGQVIPVQLGVRRYRTYHATIASRDGLQAFDKLLTASASRLDDLGFQLVSVVEYREGDDALLSSLAALRAAWSAGERGTELLWQGGGDVSTGSDGEDVLVRRIDAYRSALAGLIDTSEVDPPEVITEIPPEYTGVGTDGAIFTIGLAAPPAPPTVTRVTQRGLALTADQFERLLARLTAINADLGQVPESILRGLLAPLNIAPNLLDIEFENDQLTDPMAEAVKQWWASAVDGADRRPAEAVLLVDSRVEEATGAAAEEARADVVLTLLGGPTRSSSRTFGPVENAQAIVAYIHE